MKKKRVSLSGDEKTIGDIWDWFGLQQQLSNVKKLDIKQQVQSNQFDAGSRFNGMTLEDIDGFFYELHAVTMLDLMAAAEAAIRVDYLTRVYDRKKSKLSRRFRDLYKKSGGRVSLIDDILAMWKDCEPGTRRQVKEFKTAWGFRHWLAHGRYWDPKIGRRYAPADIFDIAYNLLDVMNLH